MRNAAMAVEAVSPSVFLAVRNHRNGFSMAADTVILDHPAGGFFGAAQGPTMFKQQQGSQSATHQQGSEPDRHLPVRRWQSSLIQA